MGSNVFFFFFVKKEIKKKKDIVVVHLISFIYYACTMCVSNALLIVFVGRVYERILVSFYFKLK